MKFTEQVTKIIIMPEGEPIFSEFACSVEIEDEAACQFIKVSTLLGSADSGTIMFDCKEWPTLRSVINRMVKSANKHNA
jgi:hypothetical protein